jgi:hypothetical protein
MWANILVRIIFYLTRLPISYFHCMCTDHFLNIPTREREKRRTSTLFGPLELASITGRPTEYVFFSSPPPFT